MRQTFDEGAGQGIGRHRLTEIVPLHSLMAEKIEGLRQWARGRARHASHRDAPANGKRKLAL